MSADEDITSPLFRSDRAVSDGRDLGKKQSSDGPNRSNGKKDDDVAASFPIKKIAFRNAEAHNLDRDDSSKESRSTAKPAPELALQQEQEQVEKIKREATAAGLRG